MAPLLKFLEVVFELFVPLVVASVIDIGIANKDGGFILSRGGLLFLLAFVGMASAFSAQYFAARAATAFGTSLRSELYRHIGTLSYRELDGLGTSGLITRMTSDAQQMQNAVNIFLRLVMRAPFIVFGSLIMAFTVSPKAGVIFVITIPLLSLVVFGVILYGIPLFRRVQRSLERVTGLTRENLNGVRVVRAFCREEGEVKDFSLATEALRSLQTASGRISALMNPLTFLIVNGAICAVLYIGGVEVDTGILTQGEVIALVNYMSQILVELVKLANTIVLISKALASGKRISQVLDTESSIVKREEKDAAELRENGNAIEFCNASLRYFNASDPSLEHIDLAVKKGETVGVIGGTGSGKTSFINLIPRFYDVEEGAVYVDGRDVRDYEPLKLREKIGIVPQRAVLFRGTVRSNLLWGNETATKADMLHALEVAQAKDFVLSKEGGLDAAVEASGRNLSGGQKQRLTIARAIVKHPEILILDDSASALDYATDAALRSAIKDMTEKEGMTVFIISQRASSVRYADKIIVLHDGESVGVGTHDELLSSCDIYREIYYSQYEEEEK